jgi:hypothetical protein
MSAQARSFLAPAGSYESLAANLAGESAALLRHPMYAAVDTPERLRLLMESHVFAVWDFMSLLTSLQQRLTTVTVPWTPPRSRVAARLVNMLVLAEESDELEIAPGTRASMSHFELYLDAMREVGADTAPARRLLAAIRAGASVTAALEVSGAPPHAAAFVRSTFALIADPHDEALAAGFLFGREDLVPEMFRRLLPEVARVTTTRSLPLYLARHIEVDEGEHGPLSRRLLAELCEPAGATREQAAAAWTRAAAAGRAALTARRHLWDGVLAAVVG